VSENTGLLPTKRHDLRYRRAVAASLVVSVLVHLALFLLWRVNPVSLGTTIAAGPRAADPVAAAGGAAMRSVRYKLPEDIVVPPPPEKFVVDERPVEVEMPEDPPIAALDLSTELGAAREMAAAPGPGLAGMTGRGDGGADAEGNSRLLDGTPRSLIPEWDPPQDVRGMEVTVRVLINERGHPLEVRLQPQTPNRGFNNKLIRKASLMEFNPVRDRSGRAIREWTEFVLVF
jgi:outer membrane biosynthesis protein TonB